MPCSAAAGKEKLYRLGCTVDCDDGKAAGVPTDEDEECSAVSAAFLPLSCCSGEETSNSAGSAAARNSSGFMPQGLIAATVGRGVDNEWHVSSPCCWRKSGWIRSCHVFFLCKGHKVQVWKQDTK